MTFREISDLKYVITSRLGFYVTFYNYNKKQIFEGDRK